MTPIVDMQTTPGGFNAKGSSLEFMGKKRISNIRPAAAESRWSGRISNR